jgi:hypothetical protein
MKTILMTVAIAALITIHAMALWAVLHPHVSDIYRAYYIDRVTTDWSPTRYPSTPAEGMVFNRDGLPMWVAYTRGLAIREPSGRWTDSNVAPVATLGFTHAFDGALCADFMARAVPWIVGKAMVVRMGNEERTLEIENDFYEYRVQFRDLQNATQLDLIPPSGLPRVKDADRHNLDDRRLGLDLSTLRLLPGECPVPVK